ncbi:L-amino acid N-acyltransferase YncA [Hydrogenophaga palleronii]|uniref:L-amino acid N-acyltransferase YncA n=1 Tax=Hydrogenophaga palleronii TaxID=65655 RepID=A0ABU1WLN2_9BURK|nr:N-acetyltransferase family protein [Hydrogenophaga palleronii]MDR7149949.1 L-amino acid N-acyltransferase YncA [Hydrogenophaga palleronii]
MLNTFIDIAPPLPWTSLTASSAVAVRAATPFEASAMARIYNESLPPGAPADADAAPRNGERSLARSRLQRLTPELMSGWVTTHRQNGRPLWVAHAEGQTVGWLSLLGFSDRPGCTCAAEVAVYIAQDWQRQGVGRTLMEHALQEAPHWGIDRLMAFIWNDNMPSRKLFAQCGFGPWGALPGVVWAEGLDRDMLILGRQLQAAC